MARLWKYVAVIAALFLVGAGGATAASLINGSRIKGRSLPANRIKRASVGGAELSKSVRAALNKRPVKGDRGPTGPTGATGPAGPSDTGPVTVTSSNLHGFTLAPKGDNGDTTDNGTLDFETPPSPPNLGTKALKFVGTTGKPVVAFTPLLSGNGEKPLLAELTHASYSSLVTAKSQPTQDVGFQMTVTGSTSTKFASGFTTVVYEPYQNGSPNALNKWQRHSVDRGKVWSTQSASSANAADCTQALPCPFQKFVDENPNAVVTSAKLKIGDSGSSFAGFTGYVDDFTLGYGPITRYDLGG